MALASQSGQWPYLLAQSRAILKVRLSKVSGVARKICATRSATEWPLLLLWAFDGPAPIEVVLQSGVGP